MPNITEVEIIEKAKELGLLLKDSEIVKEYVAAKTVYEQDRTIQELLGQFNLHKMSMAMLSKQDHPDEERIADHEKQLEDVYNKIMQTDLMLDFQQKSEKVDSIISNINSIINLYISGGSANGCTGSCSTCSGCSGN